MITKQTFQDNLKEAIRNKDELRKSTLRLLLSAIKLAEVEQRGSLDEPTLFGIIQKEIKTRQESIEEAMKAGREELIADWQAQISMLELYLPQPLSEDELQELVEKAIVEAGASGPQDMGKVMKILMPQVKGRADGKLVSDLVRQSLSG